MSPVGLKTQAGRSIQIGKVLGKGGEATVSQVEGDPAVVAKIYTDGKATQRLAKLQGMVAAGLQPRLPFAAFPTELLFANNQFAGFTMRKIVGSRPVVQLTIPSDRKIEFPEANFRFLVRVALNLAKATAALHSAGIVIGDFNESGALVDQKGLITFIDVDSFQFRAAGHLHRCMVGKAEYTPPELQGVSLATVERTVDHDAFGLAVLVFELLFMGRHPFAGVSKTGEQPSIAEAIQHGRFAYSPLKAVTKMDPPPFMPVLADVPVDIASAFQRAFGPTPGRGRPARPTAADWVPLLSAMESGVVECQSNPAHLYSRTAPSCPWCRLEAGWGTVLFIAQRGIRTPGFDLAAVLARINCVEDPGPAPDLSALLQVPAITSPSAEALRLRNSVRARNGIAVAIAAVGLISTFSGLPVGLVLLLPALIMIFRDSEGVRQARRAREDRAKAWHDAEMCWQDEAGHDRFEARRRALLAAADQLEALPALEQEMLLELDRKKYQLQLRAHLENARIARAKIEGIGDGRKAILRSFGVETAWDIKSRPISVPKFGPTLKGKLMDWQQLVERQFRFNPNALTNPAEVARVKNEIGLKRTPLEGALARGATELQTLRGVILGNRQNFTQYKAVYSEHLQTQADAKLVS